MRKLIPVGLFVLVVAAMAALPSVVHAQELDDTVVVMIYLHIKPESTGEWLGLFKKHFVPALDELKQQGTLRIYHVFVPGIHHPSYSYTHALALAYKDRAAQGVAEKKLRQVFANLPAEDAKKLQAAGDPSMHFDDEWREIDLAKVTVPEEKKPEEKKAEANK